LPWARNQYISPYPRSTKTYIWNLIRQFNILGDNSLALLDRAFHIHVLDLVANRCLGVDEADQAVLDLQDHICTLLDPLLEGTDGFDGEGLATGSNSVSISNYRAP
jgi:hypothetical protein